MENGWKMDPFSTRVSTARFPFFDHGPVSHCRLGTEEEVRILRKMLAID